MNRKYRIAAIAAAAALVLGFVAVKVLKKDESTDVSGAASALTVSVVSPQQLSWPRTVAASGPLTAWQEIIVSPETGGLRIAELLVDVGAEVKRGQVLARLADDSVQMDLRKQQAAVAQAAATLEQAVSDLQRAQAVEASGALSAQQLQEYRITEAKSRAALASAKAELDSTQLRLRQTRIVAPDDGYVSSKSAVLGNVVSAGAELFRMVRKSRVEWRSELDSNQLSLIRVGQTARIALPDGTPVEGQVRDVSPTLSAQTGRAIVYVSLPTDSAARPGMFASGSIVLDDKPALTLPQAAIVPRDGRSYVFIVDADNKVGSLAVNTGRRQDGCVEIMTPLPANARIVASGGAFLSENARVTVVAAAQAKPGAAP